IISKCTEAKKAWEILETTHEGTNTAFALGSEYSNSKLVRKVFTSCKINLKEANKGKLKFEKNIAFLVVENMSTEQGIVIKEMQEQLALFTQGFNKMAK
ncbi:hypothetical protein Goarm_004716, partial [Gossypium armourianum]|nr:hypothetical protein [Gossypium armourianum]